MMAQGADNGCRTLPMTWRVIDSSSRARQDAAWKTMFRAAVSRGNQHLPMPAFAIAYLHQVALVRDVLECMRRMDETLVPFQGVFRVHGAQPQVLEGSWPGHVIVIEFPDMQRARGWYDSDASQDVLPLRAAHSVGAAILVGGVAQGHRAAAAADRLASLGVPAKD
jgi:uncharacterized protein (DUF1330 family)